MTSDVGDCVDGFVSSGEWDCVDKSSEGVWCSSIHLIT